MKQNKRISKGFLIYAGLLFLAVLTLYPYLLSTIETTAEQFGAPPLSLPSIVLIGMLQSFIIGLAAIFIGQALAPKVGLRSLVYEKFNEREKIQKDFRKSLMPAVLSGTAVGLFIIGFNWLMSPQLPEVLAFQVQLPSLSSILMAVLYGGVAEELMLRFGFMTLLAYFFTKFGKEKSPLAYGLAIFFSAFLFAMGHYGATAVLVEMTALVWVRMLLLNGIGGLVFGWLYYRYHLEAAIVSHISAHLAMNLVTVTLFALGL